MQLIGQSLIASTWIVANTLFPAHSVRNILIGGGLRQSPTGMAVFGVWYT